MATNDKIVFEKDGTYHRGDRVDKMDVDAGPRNLSEVAAQVAAAGSAPTKNKPRPQTAPGTFNLNALRATAARASSTAESAKLPTNEVPQFTRVTSVPVEEPAPAVKEVETVMPVVEAEDKPVEAVHEEATPVVEESVQVDVVTEVVAKTADSEISLPAAPEAAVAYEETETAHKEPVKPLNLSALRTAPTIVEERVPDESAVEKVTPPIVTVPDVEDFVMVPLSEILTRSNLSARSLVAWCKKCFKAAPSRPAAIFSNQTGSRLRFYNFFATKSATRVAVVLGYDSSICCAVVDLKKLDCADSNNLIHVNKSTVVNTDGFVMACYNERLREPVVV